jgi:hypothetical protein
MLRALCIDIRHNVRSQNTLPKSLQVGLCNGISGSVCRSLPANITADSPTHEESLLLTSLRLAGKKAKSAVKRIGKLSAGNISEQTAEAQQTTQSKSLRKSRSPGMIVQKQRKSCGT